MGPSGVTTTLRGDGKNIRIKDPAKANTIIAATVAKSTTKPENFQFGRILANGATSGAVTSYSHATNGVPVLTTKNLNINLKVKSSSMIPTTILINALRILNINIS